jgi:hypothetical protein
MHGVQPILPTDGIPTMKTLLTIGNPKIAKGRSRGFLPVVLHLAPFTLSGINVCPMAELAGCVRACLNTAGHGGIGKGGMVTFDTVADGTRTNTVQAARIARTQRLLTDREGFMAALVRDIARLQRKSIRDGLTLCVRLNGTSDIRWEDIPADGAANIFARFADVQFYDYTKIPNRRRALDASNYALTFSYSHRPEFALIVEKARTTYGDRVNFAAVFAGNLPKSFIGRTVVNGDETDLRFLDPAGVVVGLTAKGRAKRDAAGFVVP